MKRTAATIFTCAFMLIFTYRASPQGAGALTGYISGPQKEPVAKAEIKLTGINGNTIAKTKTDINGNYLITGLVTGRVLVRVSTAGSQYIEQSRQIDISASELTRSDFHLQFKKPPIRASSAFVLFAQDVPPEAEKLFEDGSKDIDKGRIDQGIEKLQASLAIFPSYFLPLERVGLEYLKLRKYKEARKAFSEAAAVNDKSFNCWYGLGYAEIELGNSAEASAAIGKALELEKMSPGSYLILGVAQRNLKQYDQAERSLLKALEYDSGQLPEIHWKLAELYSFNLNRDKDAVDQLEQFLQATPDNPQEPSIRRLIAKLREKSKAAK